MAYKYRIAKLEDVPDNLRAMYKADGDAFVLDVEGVVPKERLDEFRNNNTQLQQQLERLKDVDPVKYRELVDLQRQITEGELLKKGDVEGVVNSRVTAMKAALESERDGFKVRAETSESRLSALLIDAAARTEALKLGVVTTALDDVVLRARMSYQMKDGVPTPLDDKGQVVYGKDGKTPMPMTDWLGGLKKTAPHLFAISAGGGAGGGNRTANGDLTKASPVDKIAAGMAMGGLMGNLPSEQSNAAS